MKVEVSICLKPRSQFALKRGKQSTIKRLKREKKQNDSRDHILLLFNLDNNPFMSFPCRPSSS